MRCPNRVGICLATLATIFAVSLKAQNVSGSGTRSTNTFADSREGIEQQFADILRIVRTGDDNAIHVVLDTLGIPDSKAWVETHFVLEYRQKEAEAYQEALKKFQSHV